MLHLSEDVATERAGDARSLTSYKRGLMDEAAINKLVEERVAAALAARETDTAQPGQLAARVTENKRVKDQALMRQGQLAGQEAQAEAQYKQGRFDRTTDLSNRPGVQAAALMEAEIVIREVYGE